MHRRRMRWGDRQTTRRFWELMIVMPYLGMICPICGQSIDDRVTFKRCRFGHPGHLVHIDPCWPEYAQRYLKDQPR